jgi:hypothetical protein
VNTDNHVEGCEELIEHVEGVIRDAVDRCGDQVTHVDAHLGAVPAWLAAGSGPQRV